MTPTMVLLAAVAAPPELTLTPRWELTVAADARFAEFADDGSAVWTSTPPSGDGLPEIAAVDPRTGQLTPNRMKFPGALRTMRFRDGVAMVAAGKRVFWWTADGGAPLLSTDFDVRPLDLDQSDDRSLVVIGCGEVDYSVPDNDPKHERGQLHILGGSESALKTTLEYPEPIMAVRVSPDGERIAVRHGQYGAEMLLLDRTGNPVETPEGFSSVNAQAFEFGSSSDQLIIGRGRISPLLYCFDRMGNTAVSSGEVEPVQAVTALDVSADGKYVAVGLHKNGLFGTFYIEVQILDAAMLQTIARRALTSFGGEYVVDVDFSPDASAVAVLQDEGKLQILDLVAD